MALSQEVNPLKEDDCQCLERIKTEAMKTRELIEACKRCQLPMSHEEAENEKTAQMASDILREFAPMRV